MIFVLTNQQKRERKRNRERERGACAWVFKSSCTICMCFWGLPLKTHAIHSMYFLQDLKTHAICIKKKPQAPKKMKKSLKPMCLRCKYRRRDEGNAWNLAPRRPSDRTTVYTHTPSQLRLASPARTARTARTKRKRRRNEADLPVTGGGQAGLTPLNLR